MVVASYHYKFVDIHAILKKYLSQLDFYWLIYNAAEIQQQLLPLMSEGITDFSRLRIRHKMPEQYSSDLLSLINVRFTIHILQTEIKN